MDKKELVKYGGRTLKNLLHHEDGPLQLLSKDAKEGIYNLNLRALSLTKRNKSQVPLMKDLSKQHQHIFISKDSGGCGSSANNCLQNENIRSRVYNKDHLGSKSERNHNHRGRKNPDLNPTLDYLDSGLTTATQAGKFQSQSSTKKSATRGGGGYRLQPLNISIFNRTNALSRSQGPTY
jgi:hypothetical protein